jgi:beta-xylosidase
MRSTDLVSWQPAGHALSARPSWVANFQDGHPWAPGVIRAPAGGFVMFFVSVSEEFGPLTHCIGVATASVPSGPFTDRGILEDDDGNLVGCGDADGHGNIDPAPFIDTDGSAWLYLSTDYRCDTPSSCPAAPTISVIPLAADLLSAAAAREELMPGQPGGWEQGPGWPVAENPWIVRRGTTYHLLYSGGSWQGDYAMGHATAPSPTGPFTRTSGNPILAGTADVRSPGGGMVVTGPKGGTWLAYHGRTKTYTAPRALRVDPLTWTDGGGVTVGGPTATPQFTGP